MISKKFLVLGATLVLAACSGPSSETMEAKVMPAPPGDFYAEADAGGNWDRAATEEAVEATEAISFLAYRYYYTLEAPKDAVPSLFQSHLEACQAAGPSKCQIISSGLSGQGSDYVSGNIRFRAEPAWLSAFRAGLAEDADAAGGRITDSSVQSEDLTRSILDTDARLDSQIALRDRLQELLQNREASVEELLQVERELARVQGEIESATATLKALQTRVSMSETTLSYQSRYQAASRSAFSPIGDALKDFFRNLSYAIGAVITFVALALPWLILLIPVIWLLIRWRRKVRRRKREEAMAAELERQADA